MGLEIDNAFFWCRNLSCNTTTVIFSLFMDSLEEISYFIPPAFLIATNYVGIEIDDSFLWCYYPLSNWNNCSINTSFQSVMNREDFQSLTLLLRRVTKDLIVMEIQNNLSFCHDFFPLKYITDTIKVNVVSTKSAVLHFLVSEHSYLPTIFRSKIYQRCHKNQVCINESAIIHFLVSDNLYFPKHSGWCRSWDDGGLVGVVSYCQYEEVKKN